MLKIIKKGIVCLLLLWLAGVLITGVLIPAFHKAPPVLHSPENEASSPAVQERIRCIDDNVEALVRRLQVIESAQENIILSTYYLGDDESGRDVMAALLRAADRGVKIRLLVDGFCGFTTIQHSDAFHALTESENVEAKIYNPVNLLFPWKANYRMHDKYLIADDQVYMLGGRNTRDVSLGDYPGKHDIDRDILVWKDGPGGSLGQVKDYFERVWSLPVSKTVKQSRKPHTESAEMLRERYVTLGEKYPEAFEKPDFRELTMPVESITLLTNPIEAESKAPGLWTELVARMKKGRDILVQTPYIVCDGQMYRDLTDVTAEGTGLTIITNCVEYGANPCGCADFLNHHRRLLRTGAEIWEYAGGRSSHAKSVLVDDSTCIVGTFNFDMRSTYLDTEMMLVIESPELNAHLRSLDQEYLDHSRGTGDSGGEITGPDYEKPPMSLMRRVFYGILRVIIIPLRHLL